MPADGLTILADHDAIYLGAVGYPTVPNAVSLWGAAPADPAGIRPVREPPAGSPSAGHQLAASEGDP